MSAPTEESACDGQYKVKINKDRALGFPPQYNGSNMFMPTGERLYWQAEVIPPSLGSKTYQDFEEIRSRCLADGVLFEDPEFPADEQSISSKRQMVSNVKWLRPRELVENPQLCLEGYSRFDVKQGRLGDCWMDCSLANLTMHKKLFNQVVPDGQSFDKDYAGVFHFRFWQYGRWVDVVIDDRLPTSDGKLLFLHSSERNEFWSALVEKAYAKLHGSYQAIEYGLPTEAMEDFSGGLSEIYDVSNLPKDFFNNLISANARNSLIAAGTHYWFMIDGVIPRHAYSITCVNYVDAENPLLRLRNPYGAVEWKGPWNDESTEWNSIPQEKKEALGLKVKNDGEFWMSFKDFTKYFSYVFICNVNPESLYPEDYPDCSNRKWEMSMFEGKWVKGETEGVWYSETYWCNPLYSITLTDPDVEDGEDICTVIISLMQKYKRNRFSKLYYDIGFAVYKVDDDMPDHVEEKFFHSHKPIFKKCTDVLKSSLRGVGAKLKLAPGRYAIMTSTSEADDEGEFLLRVVSEKQREVTIPTPQVILI